MDTTERRLNLASQLEAIAENIRYAHTAQEFDTALEELYLVGRDANGYHARTANAMFAEEDRAEAEAEAYGREMYGVEAGN